MEEGLLSMKKWISILLSVLTLCMVTACGKQEPDTTNTLSPASLTPREQMLAGNQDIFIYNFETDNTYKTVSLSIEVYKNGQKIDDLVNFKCALPENAEKGKNNHGSLAVILGSDARFSASVCNSDGSVISSSVNDAVQPIADATFRKVQTQVKESTAITGKSQTLAYLAYGDNEKTQGTFSESVFLDPVANAEQASAFSRIYLVKCYFS